MDDLLLEAYLAEVLTQTDFYLIGVRNLNAALTAEVNSTKEVFASVHGLLTHAGMLSKLFWPPDRRMRPGSDGVELRYLLGIDQNRDWLLRSRRLRDDLEHYEERIHSWHPQQRVIDMNVGPNDFISFGEGVSVVMNRHLDPETMMFSIRGETIDLQRLSNEVVEIRGNAQREMSRRSEARKH